MSITYGDYMDMVDSVTAKPKTTFDRTETSLYLGGYLAPFGIRRPAAHYVGRDGGGWVLEGLEPWWTRPGPPVIPQDEIDREEMGRINFTLRECIGEAARRGELHLLTTKRGRDRTDLLYRCGLGYLA